MADKPLGGLTIQWKGPEVEGRVRKEIEKRVKKAAMYLQREVQKDVRKGKTRSAGPSLPGGFPHTNLGHLARSIAWKMVGDTQAIVGTSLLYGLFLELGATIKPKQAKMLAIPVSKEARNFPGSPRDFPRPLKLVTGELKSDYIAAPYRGWVGLVEEVRKGQSSFNKKTGDIKHARGNRTILHYILKHEVILKPRPFLTTALKEHTHRITEILTEPIK